MLDERRIIPRYQADFAVSVEFRPDPNTTSFLNYPAKVVNISLGGVYLIVEEKIRPGIPLHMTFSINGLSNTNINNQYRTNGKVLRCGSINEETPETRHRYHFDDVKNKYYCAIQFSEVQFELSEKLSRCNQVL
jgi:c-di-GMP-binding flagellar brake protein YcgR